MKAFIQWALAVPQDWLQIEGVTDLATLPKKADDPGAPLDNTPGWIWAVNIQGVLWEGFEHYGLRQDGPRLIVEAWSDSVAGQEEGREWTMRPLSPDPRFGGRLNTDQTQIVYTDSPPAAPVQNTIFFPWADFNPAPPGRTRHGHPLTDIEKAAHVAARTLHGWREWEGQPVVIPEL